MSEYLPPTRLSADEWTARHHDALAETANVGELVRPRTPAARVGGQQQPSKRNAGANPTPALPDTSVTAQGAPASHLCPGCDLPLGRHRPGARYHDAKCKQRAYRRAESVYGCLDTHALTAEVAA
jgi:hypothetical protein